MCFQLRVQFFFFFQKNIGLSCTTGSDVTSETIQRVLKREDVMLSCQDEGRSKTDPAMGQQLVDAIQSDPMTKHFSCHLSLWRARS